MKRGFSLLETVGAIVVLLIIVAIAVPTFQRAFGNSQGEAAEQELARIVRTAQAGAIASRSDDVSAVHLAAAIDTLREGRRTSDATEIEWQLLSAVGANDEATRRGQISWAAGDAATGLATKVDNGPCAYALLYGVDRYETWTGNGPCTGVSALGGP